MFQLVETSFDEVAGFIGFEIVRDECLSCRVAGDDGLGPDTGNQGAYCIGIISFVSQHPLGTKAFKKGRSQRSIAALAWCEDQLQRTSAPINRHVDLGGQSSSGTPQSLAPPFWPPPLPVAAC